MRLRVYEIAVAVAAAVALVLVCSLFNLTSWQTVVFLGALALLAEWLAVDLALVGSVSLTFAIIFAAVVLGGVVDGTLVALIGSISIRDIQQGKSLVRMLFNTGQYILLTIVAGLVQILLGLEPLLATDTHSFGVYWLLASSLVAVAIAGMNMLLVGIAISVYTETSLVAVWRESFRSYSVSLLVLALLGLVLAQLIYTAGLASTFLIVIPFAVARQTFQVYHQQSRAYRDTVRSLVTVLEAKDPYTRGHSERVAWYARKIAETLGYSDAEVQKIEWAALLHDIGKVAVSRNTLTKPGSLTTAEYESIQRHPQLAVEILADIDLLAEVTPLVAAHHERPDSMGYPSGLPESEIPEGARILAVADCFDAITSRRSYRQARSYGWAVEELHRVSGTQLDSRCVKALLDAVDADSVQGLLDKDVTLDAG